MEEEKMKPLQLVILISAIALISGGVAMMAYSQTQIVEVKDLLFTVKVEDGIGFVAEATIPLQFGALPPGASSKRRVLITNTYDFPLKVITSGAGDAGEWVYAPIREIQPGEQLDHDVRVQIPKGTDYGKYTGTIRFHLIKI